jgi:hypothetical protein
MKTKKSDPFKSYISLGIIMLVGVFGLVVANMYMNNNSDIRSKAAATLDMTHEWDFDTDCTDMDPEDGCDPTQGWVASGISSVTAPNITSAVTPTVSVTPVVTVAPTTADGYIWLQGVRDNATLTNGEDYSYYYTKNTVYKKILTVSAENIKRVYVYTKDEDKDWKLSGSFVPTSDKQDYTINTIDSVAKSPGWAIHSGQKLKFDVVSGKTGNVKIYDMQNWTPTEPQTSRVDGWDFSSMGAWTKSNNVNGFTVADGVGTVILGGLSKQSISTNANIALLGGRQQMVVKLDKTIPTLSLTYNYTKGTSSKVYSGSHSTHPKSNVVRFTLTANKGTLTNVKVGFGKYKGSVGVDDVSLYRTVDVATPTPTPGPSSTPTNTPKPTPIVSKPADLVVKDWNVSKGTFTGWSVVSGNFSQYTDGNSTLITKTNPASIKNGTNVKLAAGGKKFRINLTTGSYTGVKLYINNKYIGEADSEGFINLPTGVLSVDNTRVEFNATPTTHYVISDIAYIQNLFQGQVTKSCRVTLVGTVYTCTVNAEEKYTLAAGTGFTFDPVANTGTKTVTGILSWDVTGTTAKGTITVSEGGIK